MEQRGEQRKDRTSQGLLIQFTADVARHLESLDKDISLHQHSALISLSKPQSVSVMSARGETCDAIREKKRLGFLNTEESFVIYAIGK